MNNELRMMTVEVMFIGFGVPVLTGTLTWCEGKDNVHPRTGHQGPE
jgi:hypothetical protein